MVNTVSQMPGFANTVNYEGDMQISAMRSYLKSARESVHQSVNSRNKSDVSAEDKFHSVDFDGTIEEYG